MNNPRFQSFFDHHYHIVENVRDRSNFWRLSDSIVAELLKQHLYPHCKTDTFILDIGGGTGRWALKICNDTGATLTVLDSSSELLEITDTYAKKAGLEHQVKTVVSDMTNMAMIQDATYDHVICLYGPLSYCQDIGRAAQEMYRVLKDGGRLVVMGHGHYNALYSKINNHHASIAELSRLKNEMKVVWNEDLPELHTFSCRSLESQLTAADFAILRTFGIPTLVKPGKEDTSMAYDHSSHISNYLDNKDVFETLFNLEMEVNGSGNLANNGVNIMCIAQKVQPDSKLGNILGN
jgi:SAM-dependent methyltransferase